MRDAEPRQEIIQTLLGRLAGGVQDADDVSVGRQGRHNESPVWADRHAVRAVASGDSGWALGRERPAGADVVLGNAVAAVVRDVDARSVRADRHPDRGGARGDGGRALGRERPTRADVVL